LDDLEQPVQSAILAIAELFVLTRGVL